MRKQNYQKPTMQVVKLQQMGMLMTSGFVANREEEYGEAIEVIWEE
jgi:hypothetical protein